MLFAATDLPQARLIIPAWLILPWLFVLGGVLGSFLNVVIYRLPRRISLSYPGSRCPACGHAIRWHDNIPVLGWLLLGGRCRDCGASISFRYPVVEGFVAVLFAALAFADVVRSGAELPAFVDGEGLAALPWLRYGLHLVLLCTVLCAALIAFDEQRVPGRLFAPALVLGLLAPVWRPDLHPALFWNPLPEQLAGAWRQGLAQVAAGGAVAVWLACLAWPAMRGGRSQRTAAVLAIVLVGLFLGWQAVALIAALTSVVYVAATLFHGRYWTTRPAAWTMSLLSVLVLWTLLWEPIVERLPTLGPETSLPLLTASGGVVALFSIITRLLRRGREPALATS